MILTQIEIIGLRNLTETTLLPDPRLNIVTGANGAGKSSILEAIQCLSVGHSFRTRKARELIAHDKEEFTIACQMLNESTQSTHRSGLRRGRDGSTDLRLDYADLHGIAPVTRLLPVKALTPDSHRLIQDGPAGRRQFLDWGVFHMEPSFFDFWKQYRRALSQRNQSLRDLAANNEVTSWNDQLSETGTAIDQLRRSYVKNMEIEVAALLTKMDAQFHVELRYRSGWTEGLTLADALIRNLPNSRRFRTTTDGPHRGELVIETNGMGVRQVLSRGQQKLLVYALHLAQLVALHTLPGRRAIVLCDDLNSELDAHHAAQLLDQLENLNSQLFVTNTVIATKPEKAYTRFHVEHGHVERLYN